MKPTILIFLLSFFTVPAFSQNRIGFEAGVGETTFSPLNFFNSMYTYEHTSRAALTMDLNYYRKIGGHGYVGVKLGFEKYSFTYEQDNYSDPDPYTAAVVHRSSYLLLEPTADIGIGRHQRLHVYFLAGAGCLLNGYQKTHETFEPAAFQAYSDTTYTSTNDIRHLIAHLGFGFAEHINLDKIWHITINEGFTFMLTDLSVIPNVTEIHPGYLSFQIGLMRKLKHKTIEKEI